MSRTLMWTLLLVLAGCAPVTVRAPGPERIPDLEARLASRPASTWTRIQLGAAYHARGDAALAVDVLGPVVRSEPENPPAVLLLGLAYEDLGRFADAREAYGAYLSDSGPSRLREQIEGRLEAVRREELRAAVRAAVASERELAGQAPAPMTVGVFPFAVEAADSSLRPLGRGLAELLVTDLGMTGRLRVVERSRVQYLLDELQLVGSGAVQPATGARAGRMLGASSVVQGQLDGTETTLGLQAAVVDVADPDAAASPHREEGAVARLFDMEKRLALAVYDRLGVQLTVAERERIEQQATGSIQALLAFGFGLEAMDAGRFALAVTSFTRATTLDPDFALARQRLVEATRLAEAQNTGTDALVSDLAVEFRLDMTEVEWVNSRLAEVEALVPDLLPRDPLAEMLQRETPIPGSFIRIVIRRPGGLP